MAGEAVLSIVFRELVSKLSSPILDEFGLLWGLKKEKQKLLSNLSRIKAVLEDAERQQIDLMTDKDRLGKLKDVAYDAEDLVDEFLIEALRRKVEAENQDGMGRKVGNFFSPSNPLAFHFKIAHKMKELRKRFEELAKENNYFQSSEGVSRSQPQIPNPRETASSVPVLGVYGRDYQKEKYIDSLINYGNEEVLSVIPIVGMGGLGKTTLAQYVYDDERVKTHFNLKKWVYVSEDFDVGKILAKILESRSKQSTPTDGSSMDLLNTLVKEKLGGKRYLFVLDDVWNEEYEKWDRLRTSLQCGAKGSKILVTTRSDTVARMMDALHGPRLEALSAAESWTLFEKVADPPPGFVSIGKEIVRKCGGVPLAIKTLGGMLRNKTSEREWQSVRDGELWQQTDEQARILSILRLSYHHLTSSLKQCFSYCAVIPKGRRFYKDKLIKQWIAQGFIHSDAANELLEEEGEKYFNALLQRSLFQVDEETDSYKMHDLIHDLLRLVAGKECFVLEASMMTDLTRHLALCNDETRHLALCDKDGAKNLEALKKCKKLRSMISYGDYCLIDINVCLSFKCLRVLDLSGKGIHFLPNSIDKLRHLRYFDISHTAITELPETICNLHNLQTLIVLDVPLKKWPKNMKRMISLRHIEYNGIRDFHFPKGIGGLTFLRTLPKFYISVESGARIEELKGLNLLSGNIHIGGLHNITNVECAREANLKAKKYVNSLKLSCHYYETLMSKVDENEVIEVLEPHSDLKELSVEYYMDLGLPSWMMEMTEKLTKLKKISLFCVIYVQLPPLGQLHFLESLEIYRMDAVKYIVECDGSHNYEDLFPSLTYLGLSNMPNLEGWSSPQEDGDGDKQGRERDKQAIFKCLSTLSISNCPKLTRPPRLPLLPSLESLEIREMSWDIMEIPTSQSLMKVELDKMPNLERWSPHEADDGTPVIFHSLRTLRIFECPNLICPPQLLLPALEELEMREVGCEWIGFSTSKSLKKVELTQMPNLERWSPQGDDDEQVVFNSLVELVVKQCPKMVRLPHFLPSLQNFGIHGSNEKLLGSVANYTSLSGLFIDALLEVKRLPEELGRNHTSLSRLTIRDCPKLSSLSNQLENLLALKELAVIWCDDLVLSLPDGLQQQPQRSLPLNSLEVLWCGRLCEMQTSLPGNGIVLPSLKELRISDCENIESLSADMLKNLTTLLIKDSSKVWSSLVSLENLKSLEHLLIYGGPVTVMMKLLESMENLKSLTRLLIANCSGMRSLPESIKTLTSLTDLSIENCPGMRSLPESIKTLTSLTHLRIQDCPDMRSLPEGLQRLKNLELLSIWGCPVLERRVQCIKGQDWHKVAHVPYIHTYKSQYTVEWEESSDQRPHLLLHSLKKLKLEKLLPLPSCCSYSPSSSEESALDFMFKD